MVCKDVQIEPVLQDITANKSADARLDTHARGFWLCFFPREGLSPKCRYVHPSSPKANIQDARTRRETSVRNQSFGNRKGNFTALVFTTTGGMGEECLRYHRKLVELLAMKKGKDYA